MKNFNKKLMALMLVAMTFLASCIDTEVSPEVTALRQAQVDLLNARVEYQLLQNALEELDVARTTFNDDIDAQKATADLATYLLDAQAKLEAAELALATAIEALQDFLEQEGYTDAAAYLALYNTAMGNAYTSTGMILAQNALIAQMGSLIETDELGVSYFGGDSYARAQAILADNLADYEAQLAAKQASLASLVAVAGDPATAEAEKDALDAQIAQLMQEELDLKIDIADATNTTDDTADALMAAEDFITLMDGGVFNSAYTVPVTNQVFAAAAVFQGLAADLADYNETVLNGQDDIDDAQADIDVAEAELVDLEALLTEDVAYMDAKEVELIAAEAAVDAAQVLEDAALNTLDIEKEERDNIYGTALTAAENVVAGHQTRIDEIDVTDLPAAEGIVTTEEGNVADEEEDLNDAEYAVIDEAATDALQDAIDAAQLLIDAVFATDGFDGTQELADVAGTDYVADPSPGNYTALQNALAALASDEADVVTAEEALAQLAIDVTTAEEDLAAAEVVLADAEAVVTDLNTERADLEAAIVTDQVAVDAAQADYDAQQVVVDTAQDAFDAAEAVTDAAETAETNAQAAFDAAEDLVWDDDGDDVLETDGSDSGSLVDYTAKVDEIGGLNDGDVDPNDPANYSGLYGALATAVDAFDTASEDAAETTAAIAAVQADYDAAIADLATLDAANEAAIDALAALNTDKDMVVELYKEFEAVSDALDVFLSGAAGVDNSVPADGDFDDVGDVAPIETIWDAIEALEDEIVVLDNSIEDTNDLLDNNDITLAEWTAEIARQTEQRDYYQAQYDAYIALATEYLALFNTALGG